MLRNSSMITSLVLALLPPAVAFRKSPAELLNSIQAKSTATDIPSTVAGRSSPALDSAVDSAELGRATMLQGVPMYNMHLAFGGRGASLAQGASSEEKDTFLCPPMPDVTREQMQEKCKGEGEEGGKCSIVGSTIWFCKFEGTRGQLEAWLATARDAEGRALVKFGEPNTPVQKIPELPGQLQAGIQSLEAPTWGLERIGARRQFLTGEGVHVYILDTGINYEHQEFQGRAIPTLEVLSDDPRECNGDTSCARDADGHGTHVAGTVGGKTYGVAVKSMLHSVKILGDDGSGMLIWAVYGMDWVASSGARPAIVSMSIGAGGNSQMDKTAVDALVGLGITVVVAAGNQHANACDYTPGWVKLAITVGAINSADDVASYSNNGTCVDIWAPGTDVVSASSSNNDGTRTLSGTSMACPHVSGAAALLLQQDASMSPAQVLERLQQDGISGEIKGNLDRAPNLLLDVEQKATQPPEAPAPTPAPCKDDQYYKDKWNYPCTWWGAPCELSWRTRWWYSNADVVQVRRACKKTCGTC